MNKIKCPPFWRNPYWWRNLPGRVNRPIAQYIRAIRCSIRGNPSAKGQWRVARHFLRNDWGI